MTPWNKWKWGYNNPKSVGHCESNPKREIHSITDLSLKSRKSSNEYLTSHLKKNNKAQCEQKEGNYKDQSRNKQNRSKKKRDTKDQ